MPTTDQYIYNEVKHQDDRLRDVEIDLAVVKATTERIESKMDQLLELNTRLSAVETDIKRGKSWLKGIGAAVAGVLTWIAQHVITKHLGT